MRTHGNLSQWNDDRGFGFISPASGGKDVFVHVSAFPRDGRRPQLNELLSYQVENAPDGRLRAVNVVRTDRGAAATRKHRPHRVATRRFPVVPLVAVLALLVVSAFAYSRFDRADFYTSTVASPQRFSSARPAHDFSCDGRTHCSQMHSCEEAMFFLQNCPDTRMDGNGDGVPCERQWCN